jgi:hypothetical protein
MRVMPRVITLAEVSCEAENRRKRSLLEGNGEN